MTDENPTLDQMKAIEARILAAFDRIAARARPAPAADADSDEPELTLQERDHELIEELEATLEAERADLEAERAEVKRLNARLAEARNTVAVAQEARARAEAALGEAQAQPVAEMEERISRLKARIDAQNLQFERLKSANARLRESLGVMRQRNAELIGDPGAVNAAMQAELEALRTTRAADADEMQTILEELKPLMEGEAHA